MQAAAHHPAALAAKNSKQFFPAPIPPAPSKTSRIALNQETDSSRVQKKSRRFITRCPSINHFIERRDTRPSSVISFILAINAQGWRNA
jgi:hypothetical protein